MGGLSDLTDEQLIEMRDSAFREQATPGLSDISSEDVVQERSPRASVFSRFAIKNFGNDPQAAVDYIHEKYPNTEARFFDNQIVLKERGSNDKWQPLDPEGLDWEDGTDILADIAAGVGEGMATAAGGVIGFTSGLVAGLPAGGVPSAPLAAAGAALGASIAGGSSAGAIETGRQLIGKHIFGVNKEIKEEDIANIATLGAALPFAGNVLSQLGKAGVKKWGPKVASKLSGISEAAVKTLQKNFDPIMAMTGNLTTFLEDTGQAALKAMKNKRVALGREFGNRLEKAPGKIDFKKGKDEFNVLIKELEAELKKDPGNKLAEESLQKARQVFNGVFQEGSEKAETKFRLGPKGEVVSEIATGGPTLIPDAVSASRGHLRLQNMRAEMNKIRGVTITGDPKPWGQETSVGLKRIHGLLKSISAGVGEQIDNTIGDPTIRKRFRQLAEDDEKLQKIFADEDTSYVVLSDLASKGKTPTGEFFTRLQQEHGIDLIDKAKTVDAFNVFGRVPEQFLKWAPKEVSRRNAAQIGTTAATGPFALSMGFGLRGSTSIALGSGVLAGKFASPEGVKTAVRVMNTGDKLFNSKAFNPIFSGASQLGAQLSKDPAATLKDPIEELILDKEKTFSSFENPFLGLQPTEE